MCIDLAEGRGKVEWEIGGSQDGEDDLMDCRRECFCDIQRYKKGLPPLHLILVEGVGKVCSLFSHDMLRSRPVLEFVPLCHQAVSYQAHVQGPRHTFKALLNTTASLELLSLLVHT